MVSIRNMELSDQAMDKAQRKLIPFALLMFILSFLDRVNIGFAKQAYQLSTGISDAAFALGAGIFFLGYAVFEVPSNIILHHVGARRWMARIMITWGLVATGFAWTTTETSFLALRVLLGIAEAGFFPGIVYYFTLWFSSRRRSTIMGLFYFGPPLAFVFGSPISGLLMDMDGILSFHGWQWLFVVEGLASVVVGIWAIWYLVDKPQDADWITAEEKQALAAELEAENAIKPEKNVGPLKILLHPKVLLLCAIYFMLQVSIYGVTFYLPTQVAGLIGKKVGLLVGLVSAIPWVCAVVALYTIPKYSDISGKRGTLAAVLMFIAGVGVMISSTGNPLIGILGLCIAASGFFASSPIFWTMPARFLTGVAAASAIGLINAVGNLGGFVAPNLRVWAEQAFHNPSAGLFALGTVSIIGGILYLIAIPFGVANNTESKS